MSWWTMLCGKRTSKQTFFCAGRRRGTVNGKKFSLYLWKDIRRSPEYIRCLWRGSKTHGETVSFPAQPPRQIFKGDTPSQPMGSLCKPVTAPLKTYWDVKVALHHCPPGASSSEQGTNPTLSPLMLLCTQVSYFSLKK